MSDHFTYDSLYRLTEARYDQGGDPAAARRTNTTASYLLDGVGNRRQVDHGDGVSTVSSTTYGVNSLHQYVTVGETARSHDRNGNLIDDGRLLYEYDYKNRLIAVRRKGTGTPLIARYRYDADNRRTAKILFDAAGTTVVSEVRFYYDHERLCEEQSADGTTLATYVHGVAHVDDLVEVVRSSAHPLGEATLYVHQDARGDVVALTSPTAGGLASVVERRFYDDFGAAYDANKEPALPPAAQGVAFAFQGQYFDAETGLYYFRARYYDPGTGRFIQRDPVWDPVNLGNPYTFVGNSPITGMDPYGDLAFLAAAPIAVYLGWAAVNTVVDTAIEYGMSKYFGGEFSLTKSLAVNGVVNLLTGGVGGKILRCAAFAQRAGTRYAASYAARSLGDAAITSGAELLVTGKTDPWANVIGGFVGHGVGDVAEVGIRRLIPVCFLAGTLVETREGYKPVESLQLGDEVLSRDERTGEQGYKRVARLFRGHTERVAYVRVAEC